MIKYFEVVAKCGHVGRGRYFKGTFYQRAESAKKAAEIVRHAGRVKHDHKDAILCVREITKEEYDRGRELRARNPYYSCSSVQEQRAIFDLIQDNIEQEARDEEEDEFERKERRQQRIRFQQMKNKARSSVNFWDE